MRGSTLRERYGPWVLVTGASAGIGAEFARQLAGRGLVVILVARRAQLLQALAAGLEREHGVQARTVAVDLTDPTFIDAIRPAVGGVEVGLLVNNAGTAVGGGLLDSDLAAQRWVVALNVVAPLVLAHQLGQGMRARGRGGIIFLSSLLPCRASPPSPTTRPPRATTSPWRKGSPTSSGTMASTSWVSCPGPTLTEGTATMGVEPDKVPMKFGPPDPVVAAALGSLGQQAGGGPRSPQSGDERGHGTGPVPLAPDEGRGRDAEPAAADGRPRLLAAGPNRGSPPAQAVRLDG
jgi:uncharacterized protein